MSRELVSPGSRIEFRSRWRWNFAKLRLGSKRTRRMEMKVNLAKLRLGSERTRRMEMEVTQSFISPPAHHMIQSTLGYALPVEFQLQCSYSDASTGSN